MTNVVYTSIFTAPILSIIGALTLFHIHTYTCVCVFFYIYVRAELGLCRQMLLFLITCSFSFIIFIFASLPPLPLWDSEMRLLSLSFWKHLSSLTFTNSTRYPLITAALSFLTSRMSIRSNNSIKKVTNAAEPPPPEMSVLDLPDLVLECILEKLPPEGLGTMASVCSSLRDMCVSDHLWQSHITKKWGRVIGAAADEEWQRCVASRKAPAFLNQSKQKGFLSYLIRLWPLIRSGFSNSCSKKNCFLAADSIMSRFLALESGEFCFPAQVYNRENGHVGFMLSCYDAMLSYDRKTDTFNARYAPHGARACAVESGVTWDRIRAPLVDTSPHHLHVSDCLHDLHPADHFEIQWRRNKEFPYGWWYGVVGHLETCDGNADYCRCHNSETVVLEFKQYTPGSRWRRTIVSRKEHREEGNEADGFYGGIRKLCGEEEISMWKKLWPAEVFE